MGVLITNKFGNYGASNTDIKTNPWGSLGIDEALTPFCTSMDSGRLIMA
ncbi:MAG: hypothetical protein H7836_16930 [Magnetococcus sp. YQC-3]